MRNPMREHPRPRKHIGPGAPKTPQERSSCLPPPQPMRGAPSSQGNRPALELRRPAKNGLVFATPMRNPMRDLDRSLRRLRNELKKVVPYAQPYARDTVFPGFKSLRRLRKGHNTKIMSGLRLLPFGLFVWKPLFFCLKTQ